MTFTLLSLLSWSLEWRSVFSGSEWVRTGIFGCLGVLNGLYLSPFVDFFISNTNISAISIVILTVAISRQSYQQIQKIRNNIIRILTLVLNCQYHIWIVIYILNIIITIWLFSSYCRWPTPFISFSIVFTLAFWTHEVECWCSTSSWIQSHSWCDAYAQYQWARS